MESELRDCDMGFPKTITDIDITRNNATLTSVRVICISFFWIMVKLFRLRIGGDTLSFCYFSG